MMAGYTLKRDRGRRVRSQRLSHQPPSLIYTRAYQTGFARGIHRLQIHDRTRAERLRLLAQ
ncbi:unnamed protein product [Periconia digitata]|uniref:Uncharacterized protein n=1 Tax=Periconia digitata TaxID=1303443 RepID=A0A9W4XPV3_9PLEO|nr:unnamed protein product [Periconia digitata]